MVSCVRVTNISAAAEGKVSRVSAKVNGEPVWFESADTTLQPTPEAFACAFLIPALHRGARLVVDVPVCRTWRANAAMLSHVLNEWWRYPIVEPIVTEARQSSRRRIEGTALCFSGGVDSSYTLLRGPHPIDVLISVHGFDVPLTDSLRMDVFHTSLKAAAFATGTRPFLVRTNIREHSLFRKTPWERSHGGALAAIGHLLMRSVGRLVIAASQPYCLDLPWGSHWRTDELWSSERLHVVHSGAGAWRSDKLREIASEPLIQEHLRVCWENRAPWGNCSRCEKCLRTMLVLAQAGQLEPFSVFEHKDLALRVDQLPCISRDLEPVYERLLNGGLTPEVARSVKNLLRRTRRKNRRVCGVRRSLLVRVAGWGRKIA